MAVRDENVEAAPAARQSLIRKHGGFQGWFRHLQDRDKRRKTQRATIPPARKKTAAQSASGSSRKTG